VGGKKDTVKDPVNLERGNARLKVIRNWGREKGFILRIRLERGQGGYQERVSYRKRDSSPSNF